MFVSSGEDSESLGYLPVKKNTFIRNNAKWTVIPIIKALHKTTKMVLAEDFNWGKQMHLTEYGSIFNKCQLLHLLWWKEAMAIHWLAGSLVILCHNWSDLAHTHIGSKRLILWKLKNADKRNWRWHKQMESYMVFLD